MRRPTIIAAALTAGLLLARLFGAPALDDPTGAALPAGVHLHFPALNILLAPLFDLWDGVSMLGMRRLTGFFLWSAVAIAAWRAGRWAAGRPGGRTVRAALGEFGIAAGGIVCLGLFGLVGLCWHRPMASLGDVPADRLIVDLHAHTNVSHDVQGTLMRSFDAEAARRWHRRAGFDVFFVTDHNVVDGIPPGGGAPGATPALCPGEEVSAADQHVVLLGNTALVPKERYGDSLPGILRLFHDAGPVWGAVAVASIPEYDQHHFGDLERFVAAGVGGFEIVNAAPKANELTLAHRDSVIALARARDLPLLGVSDSHGWGATVEGWTLVRAGGGRAARTPASAALGTFPLACREVLDALNGGYAATQIVERHRLRPDAWWPRWLTPVGVLWEAWRAFGAVQLLAWLGWIWGIALAAGRRPTVRGTP